MRRDRDEQGLLMNTRRVFHQKPLHHRRQAGAHEKLDGSPDRSFSTEGVLLPIQMGQQVGEQPCGSRRHEHTRWFGRHARDHQMVYDFAPSSPEVFKHIETLGAVDDVEQTPREPRKLNSQKESTLSSLFCSFHTR
jgi:hypothetical protein